MNERLVNQGRRSGAAYVLALLMLVVLSTLAVAMAASADLAVVKANNSRLVLDARLAAESGMGYLSYLVRSASMGTSTNVHDMLDDLATDLAGRLNGSETLGGESIVYDEDGQTITVPPITLEGGRTFQALISVVGGELAVSISGIAPNSSGGAEAVTRTLAMDFAPASASAFDYGIYSKGPLDIGQHLDYTGANDPSEASIYTEAHTIVITSGYVDGDISCTDDEPDLDIGAEVNGEVKVGVPEIDPPTIDGSLFEPFAVNVVDSDTDFDNGGVFDNIRILAGTDPEFGNNTVIRGVMWIESPNRVIFKNNVDFTGVIVADPPDPDADPDDHYIYFKNNLDMHGVDMLPDTPEFHDLRGLSGSAVIASGYILEFKNNFSSVDGTICVDTLILKNNLEATVFGSLIIMGDGGLVFQNNSTLTIDRSHYDQTPGITASGPVSLVPVPDSYSEGN
jgi:hypothetical protein